MPEGHTIHRLAADHKKHFQGQKLKISSPQGRFADGARTLSGQRLEHVDAHGKHLLYHWQSGLILHIHLGLYGKFRLHKSPPPEPRGAVRLRAIGDDRAFDLNGPNTCEVLTAEEVVKLSNRLGEDPLRKDCDPEKLWQRISRTRSSLGSVLMNQSIIAGVGNIYRSEILHLMGLHPDQKANTLSKKQFDELWQLTTELLQVGKKYNRIIIADPKDVGKPRSRMNRTERLLIYKKAFCRTCETAIESWKSANRTVFACPVCQPLKAD